MSGPAWTPKEISRFLDLQVTDGMTAQRIAAKLGRSQAAVQGLRRKLRRLRYLGATPAELEQLLAVNERVLLTRPLAEIRHRAGLLYVPVRRYRRRGRETGQPHLVREHARAPVEKPATVWDLKNTAERVLKKRP